MKHLLVAIDGSEPSRQAAVLAVGLAAKTDAAVTFAYCVVPVINTTEMVWVPTADFDEAQRRAGEQILAETKAQFSSARVKLDSRMLYGPAAERIAEEAKKGDYDLVVVGSRGHGAVKRLLLGSVTTRLLHICEKTMLVVR